jgi:hypothetical protein
MRITPLPHAVAGQAQLTPSPRAAARLRQFVTFPSWIRGNILAYPTRTLDCAANKFHPID